MKNKLIFLTGLMSACLFGCGKASDEEKALAAFSSQISDFTQYIKETDAQINSLNAEDEASAAQLLEILDGMDAKFKKLAEVDAPMQYQDVEKLAREASENMSLAVSCYHSFFESEDAAANDADIAYDYYTRSMKRVRYIGYMLTGGEIPEDENVVIYDETVDGNILQKWISDDEDETDTTAIE